MTSRLPLLLCLSLCACQAGSGAGHPGDPMHPAGDAGAWVPTSETCNGVDDDANGIIDEGCTCSAGATQGCWPGNPNNRGRGACVDGTQTCVLGIEFGQWGACAGAVLPTAEIEGNCVDENCDGDMPGCGEACAEFEICDNGADDDCDGLADCEDDACECDTPWDCTSNPERCTCEQQCYPGAERFCDEPSFCNWGAQECGPDGRWGACVEADRSRVPSACIDTPPIPLPIDVGITYDPGCCVAAGLCCQNYGHDPSLPSDASIGNCGSIVHTVCRPNP